ncbi:TPA: hypothetical protein HA235_06475 [Candidatus Woesearchaeota archaeon]|nr:nucleotidyltransferase domain-containing protein [Candidatus Woesearchaeota archaeon]HIH32322.1 hypothetical protein [Candidatus Woesearchaeota archaeon]HIH55254.1 hypothetical protein [Candidatus Woesearchaeota archaeon]HIJ01963.1 hypothetical protein [Candidatus Woesearchaeota archaeon]HIJ13918.1 hypothetical protein [Candidatus Woesearchaeota archaeon]
MINNKNRILKYFAEEPWKRYTFTELMQISRIKSKSYVDSTIEEFIMDNIIKKELIGRLPVYSLNISSTKAKIYAGFILEYLAWNKKNLPYTALEKLLRKLPVKDYVFIITGSYSENKQKDNSDIDVAILIDDSSDPKKVYAELSFMCEMNIPPIHLYVFKNNQFIEMLLNNQANYGKEIVNKKLVLAGGQIYLRIISEAMQHGFTNTYVY